MKKYTTLLIIFLLALMCEAQEVVGTSVRFPLFDSKVEKVNKNSAALKISNSTVPSNTIYILLSDEEVKQLSAELKALKEKYTEWYTIANENKVGNYTKEMPVDFMTMKINSNTNVYTFKPKFVFHCNEKGRTWMTYDVPSFEAYGEDGLIYQDAVSLRESKLNEWISIFDYQRLSNKKSVDDLFK